MTEKAYGQFSFELRQFRLANELSRAGLASMLGISASTLKQWEDGTTKARTYKLWEVYDRLKFLADQDKAGNFGFVTLVSAFDELFDSLSLANIDQKEMDQREIQRKLSKTILRAAQTDFGLSGDKRTVVPVPFTEDLDLFRNNRLVDIEQLLQSIVRNVEDTMPHIKKANLNSERLLETFQTYVDEANRDVPNPRLLHRKGEILRSQLQNPDIREALSGWDVSAMDGFVQDHQELMRLYFGEALHASQEVERAKIDDRILPSARQLISDAVEAISEYEKIRDAEDISVDRRIPAILVEIRKEVEDYEYSYKAANSPSAQLAASNKIKTSIKHVGIFIARMILRVGSFAASVSLSLGGLIAWLEKVSPGSFRAIYNTIRQSFPALPPLP